MGIFYLPSEDNNLYRSFLQNKNTVKKFWVVIFVIFITGSSLGVCFAQGQSLDELREEVRKKLDAYENNQATLLDDRIIYTRIGEQRFIIPKIYLKAPYPKPIDTSFALLVMYPYYKPLMEQPEALWKKGEWYKNITIMVKSKERMKPLGKVLDLAIDRLDASRIIGEQYGLVYRTQEIGNSKDWGELWVEQEGYPSYIECSKAITKDSISICKHRTEWKNQHVYFRYNKEFLSHWKEIKENVIRLLEIFDITDKLTTNIKGKN